MSETKSIPTVTLANQVAMPAIGLGTWPMDDGEARRTVPLAIEAGYRLFDTAENYRNERGVGLGIRDSGIAREELFVTTKFNKRWHGYDEAQQAFAENAERLGLEYIDLLLIHWPNPEQDRYVDAWRGMIRLLELGKVRAIGVSNFTPAHIERLIAETGVTPQVNQVQLNPLIAREAEREYHAGHGIVTESWAPLDKARELLGEAAVLEAARRHAKTPAQIVLRWHRDLGLLPIPKSSNPERLKENLDVFDFELSAEEVASISALDRNGEGAVDSDRFGH